MHGRLIVLSLLTGIMIPASGALAAPPQPTADSGSIGIRIVDVPPDSSRNDPLALLYIVNRLAPGKTIQRRIEVSNSTRSTAAVAVYPAAASLHQGEFAFGPSHSKNELASWTSVSRAVVRLQPGTKAFETVTIRVPKDASSGERYAVIWAEVSTSGSGAASRSRTESASACTSRSAPAGAPPSNFVNRFAHREALGVRTTTRRRENPQQRPAHDRHQRQPDTFEWPGRRSRRAVSGHAGSASRAWRLEVGDRAARQTPSTRALASANAAQRQIDPTSCRGDDHVSAPPLDRNSSSGLHTKAALENMRRSTRTCSWLFS